MKTLLCALVLILLFPQKSTAPLPIFGRSLQIDPGLAYYQHRSDDSIASEVRANGYQIVHYVVTADSAIRPGLIEALHRQQIGVWYLTFGNGTYSTQDLPAGWQTWRMVTRSDLEGKPLNDGYVRLCLNNPDYRAWKRHQITQVLRTYPFQGVDIVEPHWPEYPGPQSPEYGCFCKYCLAAFHKQFPEETALPDILHPDSPRSPQRDPALWRKWLAFRQASLTDFLNDLVNSAEGIRKAAPQAKVCTWTLALKESGGLQRVREVHGEDAAQIARVVRPDMHCFQTHWPDWMQADLPPTYPQQYAPFIQELRAAAPNLPLMIQADIGSQAQNRRSWAWIKTFEQTCARLGVKSTTLYEYSIGKYMDTDPPRVTAVRQHAGGIELVFTKRLAPDVASDPTHYDVRPGRVRAARVDGNLIFLTLDGIKSGSRCELTVRCLSDDPSLRLFHDFPATFLSAQRLRFTY